MQFVIASQSVLRVIQIIHMAYENDNLVTERGNRNHCVSASLSDRDKIKGTQ